MESHKWDKSFRSDKAASRISYRWDSPGAAGRQKQAVMGGAALYNKQIYSKELSHRSWNFNRF